MDVSEVKVGRRRGAFVFFRMASRCPHRSSPSTNSTWVASPTARRFGSRPCHRSRSWSWTRCSGVGGRRRGRRPSTTSDSSSPPAPMSTLRRPYPNSTACPILSDQTPSTPSSTSSMLADRAPRAPGSFLGRRRKPSSNTYLTLPILRPSPSPSTAGTTDYEDLQATSSLPSDSCRPPRTSAWRF